jgi:cytochrome c2
MERTVLTVLSAVMALSWATTGLCEEKVQALFEAKCGMCHSTAKPKSKKMTPRQWESTVKRMRTNGCPLTDDEAKKIVDYLSKNYGK